MAHAQKGLTTHQGIHENSLRVSTITQKVVLLGSVGDSPSFEGRGAN